MAKLETFPELAGLVERERSTNPPPDLDPDARQALTADLLQATEGRTVLFITHQQLRHADEPYQRMWNSDHEPIR